VRGLEAGAAAAGGECQGEVKQLIAHRAGR
jgi:hypothetical protein